MRVFIAIEVPEKFKEKLKELQKELDDSNITANWVRDYHLTLKFLGEISEVKLKRVKERLKDIQFKNFELEFTDLGVFPKEKYIKVVWIGLKPENKAKKLQIKMDSVLRDMFCFDKRFKAHITLGRIKSIGDRELFLNKLKEKNIEGSFKVKDFKLIKSTLEGGGSKYETLEVYPK